jgi:hypothetical protein
MNRKPSTFAEIFCGVLVYTGCSFKFPVKVALKSQSAENTNNAKSEVIRNL